MITYSVTTLGGVLTADEPSGHITVTLEDGSSMVTLTVVDGYGKTASGFLLYGEAAKLAMAIGACAVDL